MSEVGNLSYGFLTNQLVEVGMSDAAAIADFCIESGFSTVEIGPTFDLKDETFEIFAAKNVAICDLIYCRNSLSVNDAERRAVLAKLNDRLDWAARFDVPMVTTSGGFATRTSDSDTYDRYEAIRPLPASSIDAWVDTFGPLVEKAEKNGTKIAFENCPLMQNWAISPELWTKLFQRLDSDLLGLVYDPSHLIWEFIEPYEPLHEFADRIFAIHAKDTHVDRVQLARTGILSDFSWWSYRIPGRGDLDWTRFMATMKESGFRGPVIIEHEDADYAGSIEDVKAGIVNGLRHLQNAEWEAA